MGISVGFLEVGCFHGRYGRDGMGLLQEGLVILQSFGFEEEDFWFDLAAFGFAEPRVIVGHHIGG